MAGGGPISASKAPPQQGAIPTSAAGNQQLPVSYQMAAPLNEAELTALLMASPLYHKLEQLKKTIGKGGLAAGKKQGSTGNLLQLHINLV